MGGLLGRGAGLAGVLRSVIRVGVWNRSDKATNPTYLDTLHAYEL